MFIEKSVSTLLEFRRNGKERETYRGYGFKGMNNTRFLQTFHSYGSKTYYTYPTIYLNVRDSDRNLHTLQKIWKTFVL